METSPIDPTSPNLAAGIPLDSLKVGSMLLGHIDETEVLLVRRATSIVAVGAHCTHYGAPLRDGVLDGDTVRCPLHHACFNVDTGTALRAPAFDALPRWNVEVRDDRAYVTTPLEPVAARATVPSTSTSRMVIVGGGAAGDAAAATLRAEGYTGAISLLSADRRAPGDRPNYSKGTIAGTVAMDFNFVRPPDFYVAHAIDLRLDTVIESIDPTQRMVHLRGGESIAYDALLLATGAEPIKLTIPGAELPHVRTLRSLDDSLQIAERASHAKRAVVIGASFIGLEVAAALRARNVEVHVVALEDLPMARILGVDLGRFIQSLHERHGVTFHLGTSVSVIETTRVILANGESIDADLVVAGIGVRPAVALAASAGLAVDNGVLVNSRLETSVPGVYAAGDIARWADDLTGVRTRVEHWVVAQRQGQTAARNMLGANQAFDAIPFFWTEHYDVILQYVGHAGPGFTTTVTGSLDGATPSARVDYYDGERLVAVATLGQERASLEAELRLERERLASP